MPLSNVKIQNSKPRDKTYKLSDGDGLYLRIHTSGGKYWQLKYRVAKKEKTFSIGTYPNVSLKEARESAAELRKIIGAGIDPSAKKKEAKLLALNAESRSFEAVAREWHAKQSPTWTPKHGKVILRRLTSDIFPEVGSMPVDQINAPALLAVLRKIEGRGAVDLVHRLHQTTSQIFRYAIATGRAERDVAADLRGAFQTRRKQHMAYLKENELPEFLSRLAAYDGDAQTKRATLLLLHTFVRTGELRAAQWSEFDLKKGEWRIPAERMKMKELHIVPLTSQVVAILKAQAEISHGHEYVFPNRNKPMLCLSENTILFALYRMGYHGKATGHGFRATASTILNEHGFRPDVIERQLAHGERNKIRASYNHALYLKERREMMRWWSDYLDQAGSGLS